MPTVLLDPGMLRTRLEVEAASDVPDGQGGTSRQWQPVAALWARVEPVSAYREEIAAGLRQRLTHRVTVRFRHDLEAGMRFIRLGRRFAIRAVQDPDERQRYLICHCEEVAP